MREGNEILKRILKLRGIEGEAEVSEFLSPKPQRAYDPFLLHNMEAGVDLLMSEIESGSRICIYGDYDADGVTSICIMYSVLSDLTDNIMYYIPSRVEEGYGLNNAAIDNIADKGVDLIITVDCGSVSYDEVEHAKELGIKVIVTDHHNIEDIKADCIIINPKQKECQYPFKGLAGCGVAFKFAQAVQKRCGLDSGKLHNLLDFAAIGTVGDIVTLQDENRTIVKYGLSKINSGGRKSINALANGISMKYITSENIAFGLAPHINAAGRMANAKIAVNLLMAEDDREIEEGVSNLISCNSLRKKTQETAYKQCEALISGDERIIILRMDDIHEGIGGIVAGKIKETYYRPVIIVTPSGEGHLKGTGRSVPGVDIFKLLKNHDSMFLRFGGHKGACGFLMEEGRLDEFMAALQADMDMLVREEPSLLTKKEVWDMELDADEITVDLAKVLLLLEPCGEGNQKPLFYIRNVQPTSLRFMGNEGQHMKFSIISKTGKSIDCVLFGNAQGKKHLLERKDTVDIIVRVALNTWKGNENAQLLIEEII